MSEEMQIEQELPMVLISVAAASLPMTRELTEAHHDAIAVLNKTCDELFADGRRLSPELEDGVLRERLFGPLVHASVGQDIAAMHGETDKLVKISDVLAYCAQARASLYQVVAGKKSIQVELR